MNKYLLISKTAEYTDKHVPHHGFSKMQKHVNVNDDVSVCTRVSSSWASAYFVKL